MAAYNGELTVPQDGTSNLGALCNLIKFVSNSIDFNKASLSDEEKKTLRQSVGFALAKMQPVPFTPRMTMDNLMVEDLIGMGGFGAIWKANLTYKGKSGKWHREPVALKQLQASILETPSIWKERDVMIYLKHDRICNLMGAFYSTDAFLVMQLCFGNVSALRYKIKHENAVRFTVHLLEAVEWIHSKRIVHSDIKSDNCLIDKNNNLVLSDFGSALLLKQEEEYVHVNNSHGSPGYLDLDANQLGRFSKKTDLFSVACVIYEMDVKSSFLLYQLHDHPRAIYVDALTNGRIKGLQPNITPTQDMPRESLEQRALNSRFGYLIQKMISTTSPLTAQQALYDESLRILKNDSGALFSGTQPRKKFVTREVDLDTSRNFSFMGAPDAANINPGLLTFYYDEMDDQCEAQSDMAEEEGSDVDSDIAVLSDVQPDSEDSMDTDASE